MEGRDYEIYFSEYKDHVKEIVKNYPEKTRFYSVGGDGFFNQVIQNLVHTNHGVICLPFGTGNDFSRAIHRQMSPEAILKATLESKGHRPQNGLLFNDQVTLCAFCNGRFYGSKINDGLIDMVILPKVNRLFAPYYIYKILRKDLISCKDVVVKQVKECVITTPAAMNLDGEKKEAAKYHLVVQPK